MDAPVAALVLASPSPLAGLLPELGHAGRSRGPRTPLGVLTGSARLRGGRALDAYERARRKCDECSAAVVAVARLCTDAWREGKEPSPEDKARLGKATDAYQNAVAELNAAKEAADPRRRSPDSP